MRTQWARGLLTFVLSLTLVFALGLASSSAQDPKRIPPELEKYRTDRVGPLSDRQPDAEEMARMQAICAHQRKFEAMMELRRTGTTPLTQTEIDDYLDASGIKRGVRFDNVPVCLPKTPNDICGVKDVWMVHLEPSVRIADVDATIEALEAKYSVKRHPTLLVDRELTTGAYFVVLGGDTQAAALSQDPLVRLVERDRVGVVTLFQEEQKTPPNGSR